MRVHGICFNCRRFRRVEVTGSAFSMATATGDAPRGICEECEELRRPCPKCGHPKERHQRYGRCDYGLCRCEGGNR